MSLADIEFFNTFDYGIETFYGVCNSDYLKSYETLYNIIQAVKTNENIGKWLKKRPIDHYKFVKM